MDQIVNERLDRLERQNRRLRSAGLAAVVLLGAALVMGQDAAEKPANVIKARSFQVVDSKGKIHAELAYWPNAKLKLLQEWIRRFEKRVSSENVSISIDKDVIKKLQETDSFDVGLIIYDTSGDAVGRFISDYEGNVSVSVGGRTVPDLLKHSTLGPLLGANQSARPKFGSIRLQVLTQGGPTLTIKDKSDQTRARLGSSSSVDPKTGAETKYPGSLVLFDEKGDVIWRAP